MKQPQKSPATTVQSQHNYASSARPIPFAFLVPFALCSCSTPTAPTAAPPPPPPPPPAEHVPPPVEEEEKAPPVIIVADVGFETPESVYYDKKRDQYLVSNLSGGPHDKDGKGFISKVTPEGEVTLKFITSDDEAVTLNAPKGLTVSGDVLYVADIDTVRMFDAATGEPKGEIVIKNASLLNDIATGPDGLIYVTDTGVDPEWNSDGKDAVYTIKDGKAKKLLAHKKNLGSPNGVIASEGGAWVASLSGEIYFVSDDGKQSNVQKISDGGNDGIVATEDGRFLVSSWASGAVFVGIPGEEFTKELSGLQAPADIGYDCKRNRVLVPLFKDNKVVIQTLSAPAPNPRKSEE